MSVFAAPSPARLDAAIASLADTLITPALVIDLDAVEHNLRATLERVGGPERWRPHIKTCKQAVIVEAMLDAGIERFKVATCDELALLLRSAGGRPVDVLVAYPLQRAAWRSALELAASAPRARVVLLADSPAHLESLASWTSPRALPLPLMLDVDLGMGRTGATPEQWRAWQLGLPKCFELAGLHGYDGHIRWDQAELAARGYDELCALAAALEARVPAQRRRERLELVTSGTHSYAHALAHAQLGSGRWAHQVSPGTIVLSDLRSRQAAQDIGLRQAAFVASRVISTGRGRVTLDAGSKGISPDVPAPSCGVLERPELRPSVPSEEHLPCALDPDRTPPALGQLLWLIPQHVCTTVNLYREAVWLRGGEVAGIGPVGAAGHHPRAPRVDAS